MQCHYNKHLSGLLFYTILWVVYRGRLSVYRSLVAPMNLISQISVINDTKLKMEQIASDTSVRILVTHTEIQQFPNVL